MTRAQVTALLALAVLTWAAWMIFAGLSVGTEQLGPFSLAVTVLFAAVASFNLYLWRWPVFRSFLSDRPVLAGIWKVEIASTFLDAETGQGKLIEGYYLIRQTYAHLSIRFFTRETTSKTQAAQLVKSEDGEWTLQGTYLDTPAAAFQPGSPMHFGAFSLLLAGHPAVESFEGRYWTTRETAGAVRSLARVAVSEVSSFEAASKLFAKPS